jgi:hypothetical protein
VLSSQFFCLPFHVHASTELTEGLGIVGLSAGDIGDHWLLVLSVGNSQYI